MPLLLRLLATFRGLLFRLGMDFLRKWGLWLSVFSVGMVVDLAASFFTGASILGVITDTLVMLNSAHAAVNQTVTDEASGAVNFLAIANSLFPLDFAFQCAGVLLVCLFAAYGLRTMKFMASLKVWQNSGYGGFGRTTPRPKF